MLRSRKELTVYYQLHGYGLIRRCGLCGGSATGGSINHVEACLLKDPGVTHVRMSAVTRRVVIRGPRRTDGKLHWTSGSGRTYDIERRGQGRGSYFVMIQRSTGDLIEDSTRLSDIRKYIKDNQGRL